MSAGETTTGRYTCLAAAALFAAGLLQLGFRLKEIQIDDAASYSYASARQSERRVQVEGRRGRIVDRNGVALAENRPSASIVCHPSAFQKRTWEATVEAIAGAADSVAAAIGSPVPLDARAIRRHVSQSLAMPLVVWRDVGDRELAVFSEREREFPGFSVVETAERIYPQGALAAHVVGYVGRDRGETAAGDERFSFVASEMRGRAGLEIYYDSFLRGVPGESRLLVDARGFAIRERTVSAPRAGPDLRLSLDARIQRAVERALRGQVGACAVVDPRNGDVLALASAPGYDPNDFVPTLSRALYARLSGDPLKPLLNRATAGTYAPGSTFKPVVALAGLSLGYPADRLVVCDGVFALGAMRLRCSSRWGHGEIDLRRALMKSCNPFFCGLGMDVGTNAVVRAARALGLGRKTGIDLGADAAGVVPDGEWKQRVYGERWYPGDLAQMSIGQGMLLATPLQMALVAGAIGTGYLVAPHLKRDVPPVRRPLPFLPKQLAVVREGMRMVVAGDGESRGTGWRGGEGVPVAVSGKTGTAEVGSGASRRKNTWFIAYAPSSAPRAAVAMVVENGESGGGTVAPRVAAVLREVFGAQSGGGE